MNKDEIINKIVEIIGFMLPDELAILKAEEIYKLFIKSDNENN